MNNLERFECALLAEVGNFQQVPVGDVLKIIPRLFGVAGGRKERKAKRRLKKVRRFVFIKAVQEGLADGRPKSVDWDKLGDFIQKIMPLILQFIKALV